MGDRSTIDQAGEHRGVVRRQGGDRDGSRSRHRPGRSVAARGRGRARWSSTISADRATAAAPTPGRRSRWSTRSWPPGGQAVANYDDIATWAGAEALIDQAVEHFGGLDVLINNAGILRDKMSFNMDEAEWDVVIDVHLKGHFCRARHAAAYWRAKAKETGEPVGGAIVNTTSESGLYGNAGQVNYAAAKAGIAGDDHRDGPRARAQRRARQRHRAGGAHPSDRGARRRVHEARRDRASTGSRPRTSPPSPAGWPPTWPPASRARWSRCRAARSSCSRAGVR